MTAEEAFRRVAEKLPPEFIGRFYSPGTGVGLGKGKIYDRLIYPVFDIDSRSYLTVEGLAYVLTHECDVDVSNERVMNEDVLICPIVPLEKLIDAYRMSLTPEQLLGFLASLGAKEVSRVIYVPPIPGIIEYGGVMYLNQITNTHVSAIEGGTAICAVTAFGLQHIEFMLENHLLRPKADRLAFHTDPDTRPPRQRPPYGVINRICAAFGEAMRRVGLKK